MLKIKIITVGRSKEPWLVEALFEYEKRMRGKLEIEWVIVDSNAEIGPKLGKEKIIALDLKGKELTSEEFSQKIYREWGSRISFVIGDAEGLSEAAIQKAHFRWSLSPLTFTHQMVRLLLLEQIYRATEIERGSAYHK